MRYWFYLTLFLVYLSIGLYATDTIIHEVISAQSNVSKYKLQSSKIIMHSESVVMDSLLLLHDVHYRMDPNSGEIELLIEPFHPTFSVSYLVIPEFLWQPYYQYRTFTYSDSTMSMIRKPAANWFGDTNSLIVSGSKTFALSFSENGQTDLLQSLYVNLNGELSKGVSINAQLSDSQSRFSPEGDSKELSSIDQVFIRVFGKNWELGMGDLDLSFQDTRYMNYSTKLEGIKASYTGNSEIQAAYSAGSGKRAVQQVQIIDGKQGPYYLRPNDNQRNFLVVAGTEIIYMNGTLLERGGDYYIDYSEGSVMFRRIVTSNDLINAYFQYSDEYYRQSSYFNSSRIPIGENLIIGHHLIHQTDARHHPLLFSFSSSDLDSLAISGDNIAWGEGVFPADTGTGYYIQRISTDGVIYYEYAAQDSLANYNIVFSHVGFGKGDYEEYSAGKYRWVGTGNGSWLPVKQLIAPVARTNLGMNLELDIQEWVFCVEGLYTHNDINTLSNLDDNDNSSGIVSAYIKNNHTDTPLLFSIDSEYRKANAFLFAPYESIEYDLAALPDSDSLAQFTINSKLSYKSTIWRPEIQLRYRNLDSQYQQRALRLISKNDTKGLLPGVNWQSTISSQTGNLAGLLQYHNAEVNWAWSLWNMKLQGLMSQIEYDDPSIPDTSYRVLNPTLSMKTSQHYTQIGLKQDENHLNLGYWQLQNQSTLLSAKHISNTPRHYLDLDFSHRVVEQPLSTENPRNTYDLISIRTNNSFLKGALILNNNYQLNQTEFFPKIRELVYVGQGIGVYDSTGVISNNGEWDYEYITAPTGQLSSEANALSSIFLKPGLIFPDTILNRFHSDLSINLIEHNKTRSWKGYMFLPGYSYDADYSLFARQNYIQNVWIDLYKSLILANLNLEVSRSLDQRYQSNERNYLQSQGVQLDIKTLPQSNIRVEYNRELSTDTRYASELSNDRISAMLQRNLAIQTMLQLELSAFQETGKQQNNPLNSYELTNISLSSQLRSVLMQKYRISTSLSLGYNAREGSSYLTFLPQKRKGFLADLSLSGIYRINNISTITLEYKAGKYPEQNTTHNLKLEFKAEL